MNLNPAALLDPVFHLLEWIIAEWGVYLFFAFVWLSLIFIAWIFGGGLRRKFPDQPHVIASLGIIIQPHTPLPLIIHEYHPPDDCMD